MRTPERRHQEDNGVLANGNEHPYRQGAERVTSDTPNAKSEAKTARDREWQNVQDRVITEPFDDHDYIRCLEEVNRQQANNLVTLKSDRDAAQTSWDAVRANSRTKTWRLMRQAQEQRDSLRDMLESTEADMKQIAGAYRAKVDRVDELEAKLAQALARMGPRPEDTPEDMLNDVAAILAAPEKEGE